MERHRLGLLASLVAVVAALGACTDAPEPAAGITSTPSTIPSASAPTSSPPATAAHPVSLQALMQKRFDGRGLTLERVLARESAYTRYFVTYRSGGLKISGIMNVPSGRGPFPALVLNHGHIDTDVYVNGQGLRREQDYLARRGYVVLHTDYRNHAQSSDDPENELKLRLGYTEDVINAVLALKGSNLPSIDRERIGMLGRSMGGGVTFNALVVKPDLVKAAVVFAPVSSNTVDNFNRWIRRGGERRALAERISARYGSPEGNPEFWRNVSARSFFERIAEPLIIHHGTSDDSVPYAWSQTTLSALRAARKAATLYTYAGEEHAFGPQWPLSMRRTVAFLDRYVK